MKFRIFTLFLILGLAFAAINPVPALAQSPAYNTSFTTSITYQNVSGADTTDLHIFFYADPTTTTAIDIVCTSTGTPCSLIKANAGSSVFIGSLSLGTSFQGSAVMQSDQQLVATAVQIPQSTTVVNRALSNGFSSGSATVLIATVLKNTFKENTRFSIQNADSEANTVIAQFYNTSAQKVYETPPQVVQAGASWQLDAGTITQLGASFNGSAVVTAKRSGGADGNIVATAMELGIAGNPNLVDAFEGVSAGGRTFYMPSALCNAFPVAGAVQNTSYAIQNTSLDTDTDVTVTYSNGATQTLPVGKGSKQSFIACQATGMTNNFSGSAQITSTAADVIAIGKAYGQGLSTAFLGAAAGAPTLYLPYIRWSQTQYTTGARQRAFLAIQNITPGGASIPAGQLSIKYYDKDGNLITTHTTDKDLANGAKWNSNPFSTGAANAAEFGYAGGFGGSAVVVCTAPSCQVVAIARIQSYVPASSSIVGEDYNGVAP